MNKYLFNTAVRSLKKGDGQKILKIYQENGFDISYFNGDDYNSKGSILYGVDRIGNVVAFQESSGFKEITILDTPEELIKRSYRGTCIKAVKAGDGRTIKNFYEKLGYETYPYKGSCCEEFKDGSHHYGVTPEGKFGNFSPVFVKEKEMRILPLSATETPSMGELADFPEIVIEMMLEEQELCGNKRDIEVFKRNAAEYKEKGGFDWSTSKRGQYFWYNVIVKRNFKAINHPIYGGALKDFPFEVVVRMLTRQQEQGNSRTVKVFENMPDASVAQGGFEWRVTPEGHDFWNLVIRYKKFDVFFKKYPSLKTQHNHEKVQRPKGTVCRGVELRGSIVRGRRGKALVAIGHLSNKEVSVQ